MSYLAGEKTDIWLDCDPGLDDILAIIYASYSERLNLIGISTSPGNATLQNTTRNALDILYHIGRKDIQVYVGSNQLINGEQKISDHVHGENGLGGVKLKRSPNDAIDENGLHRAYERIMKNQNQVIWVNTGSFTNLCILLLTYPLLKTKLKEIVTMGGAIHVGNITPAAEFNIFFDPAAFKNTLKLKGNIPLVLIPLETTHINIAGKEVYDKFKEYSHHPFGLALYNTMVAYQEFYINVNKIPYPPYHDPLTIFYILHPEEFQVQPAIVEVDLFPTSYGRTNIYFSYPGVPKVESSTLVTTNLFNKRTKFWDQFLKITDMIFSEEMQKKIGIEY